jgi:hypothetical protein
MTYSLKRDDQTLQEMINHYGGIQNIPNPLHYPIQFEFLVKSFEHFKRVESCKNLKS